ncbi:hypothetical protein IF1G_08093 [Cordyceps javanica]|uniref:Uncharacterized protein n=1 Tax=Cordyceps javanica TaxID=43265 RepID=A0A545UVM4_9HYPO|nr:hypothetical protein IF1G_08093 [Cordyceps javanica]
MLVEIGIRLRAPDTLIYAEHVSRMWNDASEKAAQRGRVTRMYPRLQRPDDSSKLLELTQRGVVQSCNMQCLPIEPRDTL